jgi:hypothetical protein
MPSILSLVATATALLTTVSALPRTYAIPSTHNITARQDFANDIFYLSNCASVSQISYYADVTQSWAGQTPDVSVQVSPIGEWVIWEGEPVTAQFDTTFTSNIDASAAGQPAYTQVGRGEYVIGGCLPLGSGWTYFDCFVDTGRVLYEDPSLGECTSVYYCTNVSFWIGDGGGEFDG